jgi:hypothetical protein
MGSGADIWMACRYRHLSKDYEGLTQSNEALVYAAMIHLIIFKRRDKRLIVRRIGKNRRTAMPGEIFVKLVS